MPKPLYALLGLDDDATAEQIKQAYRSKSKECHPNNPANKDDPAKAEMWSALKTAYDTLSDSKAKAHYDQTGEVKIERGDRINAQALKAVINHFIRAINEGDTDHHDLVAQARLYVAEDAAKVEANLAEVKSQMTKYAKVRARLKLKEGHAENPLDTALRTTIEEGEEVMKQQQMNAEIVNRMAEILDRYDYEHIMQAATPGGSIQVVVMQYGGGRGGGGNSTSR